MDIQFLHDLSQIFSPFDYFPPVNSCFLSTYIKKGFFFLKFGVHKEMLQIIHDTTILVHWKEYLLQYSIKFTSSTYINSKHTYSVINNYMSYYIYYITFLSQKSVFAKKQYNIYILFNELKKKSTKVCNLELALPLVVRCKWINAKAK